MTGTIYPEDAVIMAPLSGFTDLAYRRTARRCGCRFAFTEMVDAASLAYANGGGEALLLRCCCCCQVASVVSDSV